MFLVPYAATTDQEVILDHGKRPRNLGELPNADRRAHGYNPLCGDRATVFLKLDGERLSDCSIRSVWRLVQDAVDQVLGHLTLQDLLRNEQEMAAFKSPHALSLPVIPVN